MPISATCPSNNRQGGFTLLELVVVLAIVTLLGAVVLPNLVKMQQAWKFRIELQDIVSQIRSLGYRARLQHVEARIGSQGMLPEYLLVLPPGWKLTTQVPVIYRSNGACLGGKVELIQGDQRREFDLIPPLCVPEHS
ncbi:type II secretion system GspH family protein [Pseudomonas sp. GD04087]|nr:MULTISPECIES: type II secretion system protein [unclassified Pseudomonas]MDH0287784.1 type II secretion system GspH family protein [Pseudomonas sp. GD04087]MDH1050791.1 type II secretion system GspH family protein [Pseudomonas sp. GD03903]MDH2002773.1 type II secretion system GspH family protein [Pseudomonas sp. GD03691]